MKPNEINLRLVSFSLLTIMQCIFLGNENERKVEFYELK